ncbi:Mrp/NBP35 family ATP-binding protein [Candidatus Bathyarchaeota archaeon]|nr:Mrp/NBP35 family ATP-binding protein [Candidatus Bathyarchaeota archaeon]
MVGEDNQKGEGFVQRIEELQRLKQRMEKIKTKIAVMSGKGGVGKSLVTVNMAAVLAMRNKKVGVLDADLHGPTVPKMLGLKGEVLDIDESGIKAPSSTLGIKTISMDFLLPAQETPVIWRGPLKMAAIRQFMADVDWGDLDYLLIDLPPGTGDEPLSVLQLLPEIDGVIIVTIPSQVSADVVEKSVTFANQMKAPIIGIIENMSGFTCPHCGKQVNLFGEGAGKKVSEEMDILFLGTIPLDPRIAIDSDEGKPFVAEHPDADATTSFNKIVDLIEDYTDRKISA